MNSIYSMFNVNYMVRVRANAMHSLAMRNNFFPIFSASTISGWWLCDVRSHLNFSIPIRVLFLIFLSFFFRSQLERRVSQPKRIRALTHSHVKNNACVHTPILFGIIHTLSYSKSVAHRDDTIGTHLNLSYHWIEAAPVLVSHCGRYHVVVGCQSFAHLNARVKEWRNKEPMLATVWPHFVFNQCSTH